MDMSRPIMEVASSLGLSPEHVLPYGRTKAKVDLAALEGREEDGNLILVSAVTPTKAGEGKTTVSVGLTMGLAAIDKNVVACLREPSLGPVFGIKGGGTGGGKVQLTPAADINLHFTGDLHAIGAAHNLLAALVDNDLHFGSPSGLDPRRVTWPRVLDINDRALREITIGLGGRTDGVPRQSRFDITAASEVMAILSLARSPEDLQERLGRIVVGKTHGRKDVTAKDLHAEVAMLALLQQALLPNLAQTEDGVPALVHGGPFANIAHGCSSVLATRMGMAYADWVVTEAGFGFDLGGEKFLDIKCRQAGLWPKAVVLVATIKALASHGGGSLADGMAHLGRQLDNVRRYGLPPVVAINVFPDDSEADLAAVEAYCKAHEAPMSRFTGFGDGAAGGTALAETLVSTVEAAEPKEPWHPYALDAPYAQKLENLAKELWGAAGVEYTTAARRSLKRLDKEHPGMPVCVAKTHLSFSDDPKAGGLAEGFTLTVNDVRASLGAGFVVALMGSISTMPGLPKEPAAVRVRIEDGKILGLMQGE